MTLPKLTSPTEELIAYRDSLRLQASRWDEEIQRVARLRGHLTDLIVEVIEELNRRESCPHEDFTENLEGRTCRTCGLETK